MPLNYQGTQDDPTGGINWLHIFGPGSGATHNAIGGCENECEWTMPDGQKTICYAKDVVKVRRSLSFYPEGFNHHYWHPARLEEPLRVRRRLGIFLDSMSDCMAPEVPDDHIYQLLDMVRRADWHIFFLLTKCATRLLRFKDVFPANLFVGVSMPPDSFRGHIFTHDEKLKMLDTGLNVLDQLSGVVRFMSFEPLSWDVGYWLTMKRKPLDWMIIGAASRGRTYYQPDPAAVRRLLELAERQNIPVMMKNNLIYKPARFEYPPIPERPTRLTMF